MPCALAKTVLSNGPLLSLAMIGALMGNMTKQEAMTTEWKIKKFGAAGAKIRQLSLRLVKGAIFLAFSAWNTPQMKNTSTQQ